MPLISPQSANGKGVEDVRVDVCFATDLCGHLFDAPIVANCNVRYKHGWMTRFSNADC